MFSFIAIACLLGGAMAAPSAISGYGEVPISTGSISVPRYGFNYAVNDPSTGDNKAQTESREGGVVKGSYSLTEPDGTIRVVDYTADPVSGFNAVVKRVGPAAHPQTLVATPIVTKQIAVAPAPIATGYATSSIGLGGLGAGLSSAGLGHADIGSSLGSYNHGSSLGSYNLGSSLGSYNLGSSLGSYNLGSSLGSYNLGSIGLSTASYGSHGHGYGDLSGLSIGSQGLGLGGLGGLGDWKH